MNEVTRDGLIDVLISYAGDDYSDAQSALVASIVDDAIEEVRCKRYPMGYGNDYELGNQEEAVIDRYPGVIRRIMFYHYDKMGKEGVTTFYEAGQTTSWESGGTPESFFNSIVPIATIV